MRIYLDYPLPIIYKIWNCIQEIMVFKNFYSRNKCDIVTLNLPFITPPNHTKKLKKLKSYYTEYILLCPVKKA